MSLSSLLDTPHFTCSRHVLALSSSYMHLFKIETTRLNFGTEKRLNTENPTMKLLLPCFSRFQKRGTRRFSRKNSRERDPPGKSRRARNFSFAGNALSSRSLALSVFIVKFKQGFAFVTIHLKQFHLCILGENYAIFSFSLSVAHDEFTGRLSCPYLQIRTYLICRMAPIRTNASRSSFISYECRRDRAVKILTKSI